MRSATIAAAGKVPRRPAVHTDDAALRPDLNASFRAAMNQAEMAWSDRTLFTFGDARVVGQGSVMVAGPDGYSLLRDSVTEFLARGGPPDGMVEAPDGYDVTTAVTRTVNRPCLLLKRPWYGNFGHWLVDQAAPLAFLNREGALGTPAIVVGKVKSPALRAVMESCLAVIMPGAVVREHPDEELWQFRRLLYVTPLHIPPLFKLPDALTALREAMTATKAPTGRWPRRFYISRGGASRKLVNEDEVVAAATARGFETVRPETMPFREQVEMFAHADAIVAVKGAALTNLIFAPRDCRVMVLSPGSFPDPFFFDIASARGMAYGELFGPTEGETVQAGHNAFRIDIASFNRMMDAVLPAPSTADRPPSLQQRVDAIGSSTPRVSHAPEMTRWRRLGRWLWWVLNGMVEDETLPRDDHR